MLRMSPENEKKYNAFMNKLARDTLYFKNTFENACILSIPGGGYWVKFSNEKAFKAKEGSKLITDAILEYNEITKEEYDSF